MTIRAVVMDWGVNMGDADSIEGWLGQLLRRFDPRWMPPVGGLASDQATRGGLQRISATDVRQRLDRLITFYTAERGRLLAYARRTLGADAELADDLLQEVMRKICQKPPELQGPGKEGPFLYTAIRHEAITLGTRVGRERHRRDHDHDVAANIPDAAAVVEDPVVFQLVLARALAALSRRERELIELVDIQQMTLKDAALELGIALGTAKGYRFVALRRLRADPSLGDLRTTV